jgi:hypothetical protein
MHFTSKTLTQAAEIAERIESLQDQLNTLLNGEVGGSERVSATKTAPKRRVSTPKKVTVTAETATATAAAMPKSESTKPSNKTTTMPSSDESRGTLRPAVVEILQKSSTPLKTAEIHDALIAQGYKFTFKDAKKVLGIRLYKMLGVQALGGGLFQAKA